MNLRENLTGDPRAPWRFVLLELAALPVLASLALPARILLRLRLLGVKDPARRWALRVRYDMTSQ